MPPINLSLDNYYKEEGFDSQAKFFESQKPENFSIPNFDEYKLSLRGPLVEPLNEFEEITIKKTEPTLGQDVPFVPDTRPRVQRPLGQDVADADVLADFQAPPIEASKEDLDFAIYANDSYEPIDKRSNIKNYIYMKEDSNDLLATYHNPDENKLIMAIRGTGGFQDVKRDVGIALGSFGGAMGLEPDFSRLQVKVKENEKKYDPEKITLVGHSSGGSFSNYIGVDNPHYDVITYNMGQGLPFLTDYVKCQIGGCKNIKNYRVIGDFASSLSDYFSSGKTFNIRPIKPTRELELEAESKDSLLIPNELYIPHSIDQFINRGGGSQFHPDPYVYGRKLARRVGAVSTAVGVPLALGLTKNLIDTKIADAYKVELDKFTNNNLRVPSGLYEENLMFVEDIAESLGYDDGSDIPTTLYDVLDDKAQEYLKEKTNLGSLKYIEKGINFLGGGTNILSAGIGYGLGDVAGLGIYENLLRDNHFENI